MTKKTIHMLGALVAVASVPLAVLAADHGDSPAAVSDPAADITDLYAWTGSRTQKLNLILAVNANAGNNATFSDAVTYAFHVNSMDAFGDPNPTETIIRCRFAGGVNIECWAGNDYVFGDASRPAGIVSERGAMRVFAGLRDDPFFLEYNGFLATTEAAVAAAGAGDVEFDAEGCALLTPAQGEALRGQLQSGRDGADASNTFAGQNVLAIAIQIDRTLVDSGGPILGVWAATYSN